VGKIPVSQVNFAKIYTQKNPEILAEEPRFHYLENFQLENSISIRGKNGLEVRASSAKKQHT